jgi:hypothetical protein
VATRSSIILLIRWLQDTPPYTSKSTAECMKDSSIIPFDNSCEVWTLKSLQPTTFTCFNYFTAYIDCLNHNVSSQVQVMRRTHPLALSSIWHDGRCNRCYIPADGNFLHTATDRTFVYSRSVLIEQRTYSQVNG